MKKIVFYVIIISSFFITNNLIASIIDLYQKQDLLVRAQEELEKEKKEHQRLRAQLNYVKDPAFIEKEARDKLLLVKSGEQIVVLSEKDVIKTVAQEKQVMEKTPNWQQWLELFFQS